MTVLRIVGLRNQDRDHLGEAQPQTGVLVSRLAEQELRFSGGVELHEVQLDGLDAVKLVHLTALLPLRIGRIGPDQSGASLGRSSAQKGARRTVRALARPRSLDVCRRDVNPVTGPVRAAANR